MKSVCVKCLHGNHTNCPIISKQVEECEYTKQRPHQAGRQCENNEEQKEVGGRREGGAGRGKKWGGERKLG